MGDGYSKTPQNIGNLEHGDVDTLITSPPYSESMTKKRKGYTTVHNLEKTRHMGEETIDDNIANLSHGKVDAVITSPSYADSKKQPSSIDLVREVSKMETNTRPDTKEQITQLETAIEQLQKENCTYLALGPFLGQGCTQCLG